MISGSKETARLAISEAADCLSQAGLLCHAVEGPAKELTALGVEFSSEKRGFLPTAKR